MYPADIALEEPFAIRRVTSANKKRMPPKGFKEACKPNPKPFKGGV